MKLPYRSAHSPGFSLVEVMVALIVISVGLLGIARMQALAISNTSNARMRALAAIEAASLVSAMHANRAYWGTVATPLQVNIIGAAVDSPTNPELLVAGTCVLGDPAWAGVCSAAKLAATDLQSWATDLQAILPTETVSISCPTYTPLTCQITITWTETALAVNKQESDQATLHGAADFQKSQYMLFVQP
jgi:type IV pilus assembly protein PilV